MPTLDPRVDAYIAKARPFAQLVLRHFRAQVHAAIPDVNETLNWGMPHFCAKATIAHMAAFSEHCAFGFWLARLIPGLEATDGAMGQLGRVASKDDLPSDETLAAWLCAAAELDRQGARDPARSQARRQPKPLGVPEALTAALRANAQAWQTWQAFAASH